MALLEIEKLSFAANGAPILNELNLELWEGYVHAIVGPNGAGKSTLAYAIMGIADYRDVSGDIRFDGESLIDLPVDARARRGITLGWQEPARFEGLSLEQFIGVAARDKSHEAIHEIMAKVGLPPDRYRGRTVDRTLSGGERKKAELASIVAMTPRLVILDEPDSGIDVESLRRIREAIDLLREAGSTVLLITHSMEVLGWAEHAFLMCCGQIVDKGGVDEVERYFGNRCIPCDHRNRPALDPLE